MSSGASQCIPMGPSRLRDFSADSGTIVNWVTTVISYCWGGCHVMPFVFVNNFHCVIISSNALRSISEYNTENKGVKKPFLSRYTVFQSVI